jgi:hypothetical protein
MPLNFIRPPWNLTYEKIYINIALVIIVTFEISTLSSLNEL